MMWTESRSIRRRSSRGQSLVEFALIFPILILVIVAVFDVGRLVFAYNTITNAAREATRFGIVDQTDTLIKAEAVSQSTSLGIPAANVVVDFCNPITSVCTTTRPTNLDALVRVRVSYSWTAITPIIGNLIGPKTITADSRMVIERVYP
jgi:Flp pilus assembly protein TadG